MNTALLPTVQIGMLRVTRLIIGGNPFRGNSHTSAEMDAAMQDWYTVARIKQTLHDAEAAGINAVQARGDALIQACIREYWAEGGQMQFIAQTASELADLPGHVAQLARFGAAAIYVHGSWTDRQHLSGHFEAVGELAKRIRETGVAVGVGSHMPKVIDEAQSRGWDLDFFMTGLYNLSAPDRRSALEGGAVGGEQFDHADRARMLACVRRAERPCLVFKILGAGRMCGTPEQVRASFSEVTQGSKPGDAMVVGMYTRHGDQVRENAGVVRDVCG